MKAVVFHQHGGLEQLRLADIPDPKPGPDEALIRVKACALNHLDIWVRQGIPAYSIPLPHISGCDISGVIEGLGRSTPHLEVGKPVFVAPGLSCWRCQACITGHDNACTDFKVIGAQVDGGYAERVKVPLSNVFSIPGGLSFEQAAAFPLVSLTAWHMVIGLASVRPGETVLVMGAGSGVGSMAVQIAKLAGCHVITTVGSDEKKLPAQQLGADAVVNHALTNWPKTVYELTHGRGVDVIIEHIGEQMWESCLKLLARRGRLVTCGATTGGHVKVDARFVFSRQLTIMGAYLGTRAELMEVASLVGAGKLKPVIDRVFPLEQAREAQEVMLSRKFFGKLVLAVS